MKKILGISLVAVLAVSPMMAMAAVTDAVPVHDNNAVVPNVDPGFALAPASNDTDNNAASAGYVKGAYNAAIKAVNKVNAKVDTKADSSTVTTLSGRVDNLANAGYITKDVDDLANYTTTTDMNTALDGKVSTSAIAEQLNGQSTNAQVAGAKATYDAIDAAKTYASGVANAAQTSAEQNAKSYADTELAKKQNTLSATNQLDTAYIATGANAQFVTAAEKSGWDAKQAAITSTAKLGADLVDDTNSTNKFVTAEQKAAWNGLVTASANYATKDGVEDAIENASISVTGGAITNGAIGGDLSVTKKNLTIMTDWSDETNGKTTVAYVEDANKGNIASNVSISNIGASVASATYPANP